MQREEMQKVSDIQAKHADHLMSLPNVVGVAIGMKKKGGVTTDQLCLVVMVSTKVPSAQLAPEDRIPSEIEGVPVDVQEMGMFVAQ